MPRYKLRTLLILLAVAPPLLAGAWWVLGLPDDAFPRGLGILVLLLPTIIGWVGFILWLWQEEKKRRASNSPPVFRFSVRDVLWATVVVVMALVWWADHRILWHQGNRAELRLAIEKKRAALSGPVTKAALDRALQAVEPKQ
jgi:hypothetical protein